jgi:hypothetical protein
MATWTDLCYVRQTVCEKVSEELYEHYGEEITEYFKYENRADIEENTIFAYCLGIMIRHDVVPDYDFKKPFAIFLTTFFDAYAIV